MTPTSYGVKIYYKDGADSFTKSFSGMDNDIVTDSTEAKTFVKDYSKIVQGTAETFDYIETEEGIEVS